MNDDIQEPKESSPTGKEDLIFASNLLRGAFGLDVFLGRHKPPADKPLIRRKDSSESTIYPEVNLISEEPPGNENFKYTPTTNHNYNEHRRKVQEIVEMIQRNKNNYYFKVFMDKSKEK